MCKTNQERLTLGRKIMSWLTFGVFVASQSMVLAAPIMPDNNAVITERPLVQETANQIPLVNVTAPTNGGVSMNKYDQFNVEKQGAILNNSYVTSKTELAGYVQGNSNMVNGTAKVIVNQVTSDTPTSMNGYLEVAGQKASVVVANPNGITVNGGGFLNTEHAVLTTGRAELDGAGNLQNYRVEQGKVSIEGKGLDGKRADSVSILARTIDVNAGVWANKLNTRTGQNHIDANNLKATALESSTVETKPTIGLDVAAVGGMYANYITMVGTEAGVGVNLNGVVAGTQSVSVDANGHLSINGTLQSDTSLVAKANSIQNTKTIASGGDLALETKELTNTGHITSAKNGHVKVEETLTNNNTMAAGANTQGALTGNGSLSIEAGTVRNTDAVIVSGGTTTINSNEVHNTENGRIYGGKVAIQTKVLENRKNVALESKLDAAMADMKAAEDKLEAAYAVDTTAFTSKTEQDEYLNRIKELSQVYDEKLKAVKLVQEELSAHKGSTIAGREDVTIEADSILNREKSLVYSGGTMTLDGHDTLHNIGGTIEGLGKGVIRSKDYQNKNSSFTAKRVSPEIDKGLSGASNDAMLTEQEDQILITDKNHSERGQAFKKSEFSSLDSGYGAIHNRGNTAPMPIYDAAEYVTVEQITPEEKAAGEEPIPAEYIGTQVPSYAYDDPIFKEFGITSMTTERPQVAGPEQEAWDAQFKPILASLNDKIKAHNAKAKLHNQKISGVANEKIDEYTIIRTKTMTSKEEVKNSTPGVVRFGGDLSFTGNGTNENSQMVVAGTLTTTGAIDQVAKENQEVTNTFGTTEASYTYKRRWPHKSRRRGYKGQVFMTPQVNKENPISLGVAKKEDKNGKAKGEVGANHRKEIQDFLNPFAQDSSNDASKPSAGTNILALPTESLYRIHPESTANYVVETDPQFTNKKAFLSSDYMYREMKTKPENIEKRLGDGLYEQTLVRHQIVSGTGYRFLDGYTDDESQFKALMDAGIAYAKQHGIVPGVALTAEQAASLTSDMIWLVKDVVMVEGKPVEVIYPKVYLKQSDRLQLHTDGTLISANTLVMNAKKRIHNEGVIQGKTVVLASNQDIINSGHINADKVGLQSDTTIHQQGQIVGHDAVELQAKEDITFNNSTEHLKNQDVLHKTAGIAVTGDTGVMIVSAGNDVNLGGATIEALGKEGAITITAGRDINSTTDTLTAKKDMTQDGDNYLRTYRQTELGTTIEAGGNVSIGAKHDIKARNLTVSSDSGAVKVIGEHDVSIENGYGESKDAFALKYKEKGLLNKKETKIKTNDESKNALMSTVSGHTVVVGANNDVTLTSSNVVSTAGTSVLAGHNVITDAAAEHTLSTASKDVKKSGIMGAGMGIMIGKKQSKDNYYIDETTHKSTTLGATDGKVTVQAGDTVHLTTTNAVGKVGVIIVGQDILLDGKADVYKQEERHEQKSSGLTVSLGGSVVEKLDSAVKKQHSASNRKNNQFKSLEGKQSSDRLLSAIGEAKRIVDRSYNGQMRTIESQLERVNTDIVNTAETDTAKLAELKSKQELLMKKRSALEENKSVVDKATDKAIDRAINVQIGIGSSKSVAESKLERHTYSSGTIDSDGTVLIHANSADSIKGNITAIGEQIKGKNVQLAASNTINLEAGSNTQRVETNSKSSGWNVSANIGMRTGGLVGWSASAYKGSENGIEDTTTHTGTHVVGTNNVSIESGSNTNLIGSTVSGQGVTAKVGNNLTVESLQDSRIYHETSKNKGISISGANFISQPTINGVNVKGNVDSTYKSVTDQSGIYVGNDGVNITVGNTTTLKGATITSKALPEKNKLSTKSLVMEDLHNEASYKAKKSGIAMNTSGLTAKGILGKINPLGISPVVSIPVSDEVQSTTKSAISDTILVEVDRKPLTDINRDTEHALNSIKPIFDKADVKERMEYVNAVSDEGFKLIGDIAMKQVQKYEEKAANTSDEALKKRYQKEADKWKDGGIYKVALHGGFGAVVSNMAGGSSLDGFATASANEIMVGAIAKELAKHPNSTINADGKYVDNSDVYKFASAVLGNAISHSSLESGIAMSATINNFLTHEQVLQMKKELRDAKTEEEKDKIIDKWNKIDKKQDIELENLKKEVFVNVEDNLDPNKYFLFNNMFKQRYGIDYYHDTHYTMNSKNKSIAIQLNPVGVWDHITMSGFDVKTRQNLEENIRYIGLAMSLINPEYGGRIDSIDFSDPKLREVFNNLKESNIGKGLNDLTLDHMSINSIYRRSNALGRLMQQFDVDQQNNESDGNQYSKKEIDEAERELNKFHRDTNNNWITPGASVLLDTFIKQNFNRKDVDTVFYTQKGYPILKYSNDSLLTKSLRDNYSMNKALVRDAYELYKNKNLSQVTKVNSYSYYWSGVDGAFGQGTAAGITTIRVDKKNKIIKADIIVLDNWDHSKKVAIPKTFYSYAYILQQSGRKKTFGYLANYTIEIPIDDLNTKIRGYGYGIRNADI